MSCKKVCKEKEKGRKCCKNECRNFQLITSRVTGLSPFPCPPTSDDPTGTGAVFPNTEAEPDIAVGINPVNEDKPMVVVCWQQDRYNHGGGCNADYMKISLDGGKTFGVPIPLPNVQCFGGPYERASDPHVVITSNGDILFCGEALNVVANGASGLYISKYDVLQGKFVYVTNLFPTSGNLTGPDDGNSDYPTLVVDPQDCSGNTAYMGWTNYWLTNADLGYSQSNMKFSKTTDGLNWTPPTTYAETPLLDIALGFNPVGNASDTSIGINTFTLLDNPCQPFSKIISIFNDTVGFDYGAVNQYNILYSVYSLDQGKTWSTPLLFDIRANGGSSQTSTQIIDPDTPQPNAMPPIPVFNIRGGDGNGYPVSDRKRNRIFVVANLDSLLNQPASVAAPSGVYLFVSLDAAKTWKTVGKINQNQQVQAFNPSISILDNGHIVVTYYDFRNHKPNPDLSLPLETDRWMDIFRYNEDSNTVTLMSETRLTPTSFNMRDAIPVIAGNQLPGGYFLGDYMGLKVYKNKIYNAYGIANADRNNMTDIYLTVAK